MELESMISGALKRKIAVAGPDVQVNHDTFDSSVLKALNSPDGGVDCHPIGGRGERGGDGRGREEDEGGEEDEAEMRTAYL